MKIKYLESEEFSPRGKFPNFWPIFRANPISRVWARDRLIIQIRVQNHDRNRERQALVVISNPDSDFSFLDGKMMTHTKNNDSFEK